MRRGGRAEHVALRASWTRWVALIELFARRRRGRLRVEPQAYRAAYRELIDACRSASAVADEPERAVYRDLENLARPWLSPWALARADRDLLLDLLIRCRQAERALGGRARTPPARRWAVPSALAAAAGAALALSAADGGAVWARALDEARSWSVAARFAVLRMSALEQLTAAGIVVVVISAYLISRTARS